MNDLSFYRIRLCLDEQRGCSTIMSVGFVDKQSDRWDRGSPAEGQLKPPAITQDDPFALKDPQLVEPNLIS